ncbi:ABC transporter permease [Spirosoma pomorum]
MKQVQKIAAFVRLKTRNAKWLVGQIALTYLVLFAAFTWLLDSIQLYSQTPTQQIQKVYTASLTATESAADSAQVETVKQYLMTHPTIEQVSVSSFNTPFSTNTISYQLTHQATKLFANVRFVDPAYAAILALDVPRGRWFAQADTQTAPAPAVINTTLAQRLFANQPALGQRIQLSQPPFAVQVVGVVTYRGANDELERAHNELFLLTSSGNAATSWRLLLRSRTPLTTAEEAVLIAQVKQATTSDIRLDKVADQKQGRRHQLLMWRSLQAFITVFCSLFCVIGLLGTLLTELYRRREEVGLRRVVGASLPRIWLHLLVEYGSVSLYVMGLASLLTMQFPLLDLFDLASGLYWRAMVLACLSVLVLSTAFVVGVYYPLLRFTPAYSIKPYRVD